MKIYERIFARLEEIDMTQSEFSRITGIATSTISDWKKKEINPQSNKLVNICKALGMSLAELLCDEENVEKFSQTEYNAEEKYLIECYRNSTQNVREYIVRYMELLLFADDSNSGEKKLKQKRNI